MNGSSFKFCKFKSLYMRQQKISIFNIPQQFLKGPKLFFQLSEALVLSLANFVKKDSVACELCKILSPVTESFPVWAMQYLLICLKFLCLFKSMKLEHTLKVFFIGSRGIARNYRHLRRSALQQ